MVEQSHEQDYNNNPNESHKLSDIRRRLFADHKRDNSFSFFISDLVLGVYVDFDLVVSVEGEQMVEVNEERRR